ncbi:MAG: helix-turn-helix domain-containing protein [Saprospiraceae bacterium]
MNNNPPANHSRWLSNVFHPVLQQQKNEHRFTYQKTNYNPSTIGLNVVQPLTLATKMEDPFIEKVKEIVEANYTDETFALPALCEKIGLSRSQLYRKLMALIEQSPSDFIKTYRLEKGKKLLDTTDLSIKEVAWKVGFKEPAYFTKTFRDYYGFPPSNLHK